MLRRFLAVLLTCSILLPATVRAEDEAAPFETSADEAAQRPGAKAAVSSAEQIAPARRWRRT